MRLLEQVEQLVPINDTVFFITQTRGARGAFIRARASAAGTRIIIDDSASGYTNRIASMLIGGEDQNNGNYVFTPITGDFLVLTTAGPGTVTLNLSLYDEPPPTPRALYFSDFRTFSNPAATTNVGALIHIGRFPATAFTIQMTRAGTFFIDQSVDGVTIIPDVSLGPTFGATGGTATGGIATPGPSYRFRLQNTDGALANDTTIAVAHIQ